SNHRPRRYQRGALTGCANRPCSLTGESEINTRPRRRSSAMTVRAGDSQRMTMNTADTGETSYSATLRAVAEALRGGTGPVALVSHGDPDGDALGSTLALKRALDSLGFDTVLALDVPPYLQFLVGEDEVVPHLEGLADGTLLCILDVA